MNCRVAPSRRPSFPRQTAADTSPRSRMRSAADQLAFQERPATSRHRPAIDVADTTGDIPRVAHRKSFKAPNGV